MTLFPSKTPAWIKFFFSKLTWDFYKKDQKKLYLTFDDGPIPEITEFVLDTLKTHQAKATFFCIGDNIRKHPSIFNRIIIEGHAIGNHTFNHLNCWKTPLKDYLVNIDKGQELIQKSAYTKQKLFRPPYGKITKKVSRILQKQGYTIIMWDVLAKDWEKKISPQQCLKNVLNNTVNGSIIVLHDSHKAAKNMQYVLPKILMHYQSLGYSFEAIKL
ncbi:polysaccharide deacetylase family protein [Aquimarina rhabdastrellae]